MDLACVESDLDLGNDEGEPLRARHPFGYSPMLLLLFRLLTIATRGPLLAAAIQLVIAAALCCCLARPRRPAASTAAVAAKALTRWHEWAGPRVMPSRSPPHQLRPSHAFM